MVNIYVGFCAVFATQPDIPMRLPIHVFFFLLSFFLSSSLAPFKIYLLSVKDQAVSNRKGSSINL